MENPDLGGSKSAFIRQIRFIRVLFGLHLTLDLSFHTVSKKWLRLLAGFGGRFALRHDVEQHAVFGV